MYLLERTAQQGPGAEYNGPIWRAHGRMRRGAPNSSLRQPAWPSTHDRFVQLELTQYGIPADGSCYHTAYWSSSSLLLLSLLPSPPPPPPPHPTSLSLEPAGREEGLAGFGSKDTWYAQHARIPYPSFPPRRRTDERSWRSQSFGHGMANTISQSNIHRDIPDDDQARCCVPTYIAVHSSLSSCLP